VTPRPALHFSVDDVAVALREAAAARDLWAVPTFAYLRDLHERCGVVVSLYPFLRDGLLALGGRHHDELTRATPWLKWGFHGCDADARYGRGGVSVAVGVAHQRAFATALAVVAGAAAVDVMPRVHRFAGRLALLRRWRDAPLGLRGLLSADDDRAEVYHLAAAARFRLRAGEVIFDPRSRLYVAASLPRLEGWVGERATPLLDAAWAARSAASPGFPLALFTHEGDLARTEVRARIEAVIAWGAARRAVWTFPQDALSGSFG
jgi:hypothetical protein